MKIKDFILIKQDDYDVYDKDFDMSVTCCDIYPLDEEQEQEYYYKVMDKVYGQVELIDWGDKGCEAVADWSGWIVNNWGRLTAFMQKHWENQYEDPDDFTEQWIREIHLFFAGYANEEIYEKFYREVLE